jgi:flagellin-like protein
VSSDARAATHALAARDAATHARPGPSAGDARAPDAVRAKAAAPRASLRPAPPPHRAAWRDDERGLTPVVGTLLVLAITIIGMAGIMFWGAPTIERLRVSNTQSAMVGEFLDIRQSAAQLTIPDAARTPRINVPGGVIGFETGTRFLISAVYSEASGIPSQLVAPDPDPTCDFHVTGWADATPTTVAIPDFPGCGLTVAAGPVCGSDVCVRVYRVLGASLAEQTITYTTGEVALVTPAAGVEFTNPQLTWLFRLTNSLGTSTFGEAWLISSDLLYWRQGTSSGEYEAFFDSGAVFSGRSGAMFLDERPLIQENMFGTGVFSFWLYAMDAFQPGEITAVGTYQVFVGLLSLHPRVQSLDVPFVRLDFHGLLAEAWCGGLVVRNNLLGYDTGINEGYLEQPGFSCATGDESGVRSVKYNDPDPQSEFPFQLIHATLRTHIQL